MADLNYQEKRVLEKLFGMSSGYVMGFTKNFFKQFIGDVINIDVYNDLGYRANFSMANKLRQIWKNESNSDVGILIENLLSYYENEHQGPLSDSVKKEIEEMRAVASRLQGNAPRIELPSKQEDTLQTLLKDINNSLSIGKSDLLLDRLHTFSTKLLCQICIDNGISVVDDKGTNLPLHSLAGMLCKKYEKDDLFQSSFTLAAIQNSISLFDKYNSVRDSQSYAHDNDVLGTMETEFAVRIMADLLSFIDKAEMYRKKAGKNK